MSIQEEIISKIIEETGADRNIAELAFNLSNQKIDSALNIIRTKVAVIQGKIIAENAEISGLFIIKFFQNNNFINPSFFFSRDDDILSFNISLPFHELELFIKNKKIFLDEFLSNLSEKLRVLVSQNQNIKKTLEIFNENFTDLFIDNTLEQSIVSLIKKELEVAVFIETEKKIFTQAEYEFFLSKINSEIQDVYGDDEFKETISSDFVNKDSGDNNSEDDSKEASEKQTPSKDIFLKAEEIQVLPENEDLKKCKLVSNLAIGDKIMIKMNDSSPQSNYIFNILKLDRRRVFTDKIETKIIKIDKNEKEYYNLTVELIPGIYSKLRIKISDKILINDNLTSINKSSIIILILCLLFAIFMIYYFIDYIKR
ncbi:MAG TPA: hypothetical protein PKY81_02800 [bacterium]|nr:hypothetical protein [bacterium]HPN29866.1 hypothetical protein [bacterium]